MVGFHESAAEMERDVAAAIGAERAASPRWRSLLELGGEAMGLPRHASQHSGGMVISTAPLVDFCPIVPAAMAGRQILQWDKDSCADAGLLKIDLLGLGMLSAVERCVDEIEAAEGETVDLSRIPLDDEATFESIRAAATTGVFQIESRAQMQMLPRTQPQNLDDLTVQVALVRPGPIQGGAVHPYIERRKPPTARRPRRAGPSRSPTSTTRWSGCSPTAWGTIVYQEQVLEVAIEFAGFSSAQAEGLRRAMSRKRSAQAIEKYHREFIAGAIAKYEDASPALAERIWGKIQGFSGFGFPKAPLGRLRVARLPVGLPARPLRRRVPLRAAERAADGLLPARRAGPRGRPAPHPHRPRRRQPQPPSSATSNRRFAAAKRGRRGGSWCGIGLGYVKGVRGGGDGGAGGRARARRALPRDRRAGLALGGGAAEPRKAGLGGGRSTKSRSGPRGSGRRTLWSVGVTGAGRGASRGATQLALPLEPPDPPELETLGEWGEVIADYRSTGMTLGRHPMELMRPDLDPKILRSSDLDRNADGATVEVAGMVVARQRPETAKGIVFMLLEDERGTVNLIVPPPVYDRRRALVRAAPLLRARGRLERREGTDQRPRQRGRGTRAHRGPEPGAPRTPRTPRTHSGGRWASDTSISGISGPSAGGGSGGSGRAGVGGGGAAGGGAGGAQLWAGGADPIPDACTRISEKRRGLEARATRR